HSTPSASFGSDGTSGTSLGFAKLAIDQSSRILYARIENGEPGLFGFDLANPYAPLDGNFPLPQTPAQEEVPALAVDTSGTSSAGNIYFIAHPSFGNNSILYGFDSTGAPLEGEFPIELNEPFNACGIAVDSSGNIWFGDDTTHTIKEYSSTGLDLERSISIT